MEISLENRMLFAIQAEDLQQVSKLLSKGANPNKTVCNGKTCLGEAAFKGLTDIAKLLIAGSHSDIKKDYAVKKEKKKKRRYIRPLNKKIDMESLNRSYPTEKVGKKIDLENLSKCFYKISQEFVSNSKASKVPLSSLSDLEWDENIGNVAANTKEDDASTALYKWYASILEIIGDAVLAASDLTCGIDQEDAFGKNPVTYACEKNNFDIFKALVDAGCKIDSPCTATGMTVLHSVCTDTRIEFIKVLLAAGCNVNVKTPQKTTAFHIAVTRSLKVTIMLFEHGAILESRDEKGRTPMFMAAEEGRTDIVYYLFKRGAAVHIEDSDGHTPLCLAVLKGHNYTVSMLFKNGARITHHRCLLHTAVEQRDDAMFSLLLKHGCDINVHDNDGDTPLLFAMALYMPLPPVRLVLEKGANVNACNSNSGLTVLHMAIEHIMEPAVFEYTLNIFLDYNINMDTLGSSTRDTALNRAILLNSEEHAMQIIRYGANVNLCEMQTGDFNNLILASSRKSDTLANMLIKAGHKKVMLKVDQHSSNIVKWIDETYKAPLSLENICRIRIRNLQNKINLRDFVQALPIPKLMKRFLMMEEFLTETGYFFHYY